MFLPCRLILDKIKKIYYNIKKDERRINKLARGTEGKANLAKKFAEVFGNEYIGEVEGAHWFWTTENGDYIQIKAAVTCPKVQLDVPTPNSGDGKVIFEDTAAKAAPVSRKAELDEEEKKNLERLMKELDL